MKKTSCRFLLSAVIFTGLSLSVNAQDYTEPPIATNTINAIGLRELNLRTGDYEVMKAVTENAVISVEFSKKGFTVQCEDEDFMLKYKFNKDKDGEGYAELVDWNGVIKQGYLSNTAELRLPRNAAEVAKRLAIYRLINTAAQMGADGVVEPVVSMNMAKNGKLIYYKTTVTGRLIKLKTTK